MTNVIQDFEIRGAKRALFQLVTLSNHRDAAYSGTSLCGEQWIGDSDGACSYVCKLFISDDLWYVGQDGY